ncbi:MAG: DUF262 domain-containing protein [Euryarchaeota archaeon]|nr:DUF262 domain-containing protein [Euryarchaeota archaeon]
MVKVNLDALIPREDFEAEETPNPGKKKETISIEDLKSDSFFLSAVRKPDFQRETNEWDGERIVQFIESFINGDLIPAIILWRSSGGYLFAIDGSHRLSSLIAWINNDYGDGNISKRFYDGVIPDDQIDVAEKTRNVIRKKIGTYEDYKLALTNPDKVTSGIIQKAKNLAAMAVQLQWVEGDVRKAETSFFKINQQAAPIDSTELKLLKSRKKPNCIAARAIIRSGKGYKYWSQFSHESQDKIQKLAEEVNDILFSPKLETPIKTLDIPIGGKLYSPRTLPLILEFVNITNKIESNFGDILSDDEDGKETIKTLYNTRKVAQRINSMHPSSLGLHPIVYFYSQEGRHKTASFFATVSFVMELEEKNKIDDFINVRASFESILLEYDFLVQQITRKHRSAEKSYPHIKNYFFKIIELLNNGIPKDQVINKVTTCEDFNYLTIYQNDGEITSKDFSSGRKSAVYIRDVISKANKCKICGGYIHRNSLTIDHITRKADGGLGAIDNGQITHPYCNTTYKN